MPNWTKYIIPLFFYSISHPNLSDSYGKLWVHSSAAKLVWWENHKCQSFKLRKQIINWKGRTVTIISVNETFSSVLYHIPTFLTHTVRCGYTQAQPSLVGENTAENHECQSFTWLPNGRESFFFHWARRSIKACENFWQEPLAQCVIWSQSCPSIIFIPLVKIFAVPRVRVAGLKKKFWSLADTVYTAPLDCTARIS